MKCYKNKFVFRTGTTSYILHARKNNLIKNIHYLKNNFDFIQLLFFGKDYLEECINDKIINEINAIRKESPVKFSIHLPLDLNLLDDGETHINSSLDAMKRIFDKTAMLDINEYILHLDRKDRSISFDGKESEKAENILTSIKKIISPEKIYIENTSYDISFFAEKIIKNNFSVCLDIPHSFIYKYDFQNIVKAFGNRIKMLHIYGFKTGDNHKALSVINKNYLEQIISYMKTFKDDVVIEVFGKRDLKKSLKIFEKNFKPDFN